MDEEKKAEAEYQRQVRAFREALSKDDRCRALELIDEFDWPTDMIADELIDWLHDRSLRS